MVYKPGDQPDPEFTAFFAGPWQELLKSCVVEGTDGRVSWDRRAAYLLWTLGGLYGDRWLQALRSRLAPPSCSPVGIDEPPVNLDDYYDCQPVPGGIDLVFDSGRYRG